MKQAELIEDLGVTYSHKNWFVHKAIVCVSGKHGELNKLEAQIGTSDHSAEEAVANAEQKARDLIDRLFASELTQ